MRTAMMGGRRPHKGLASALCSRSIHGSRHGHGKISVLAAALLIASGNVVGAGGGGDFSIPPIEDIPPNPPNPKDSRHFLWTGADKAHAEGLTGAGIRIGILDTGVRRDHPALRGRVASNLVSGDWRGQPDDLHGHGTIVAQVAAGDAFGEWSGGIAPGTEILSARAVYHNGDSLKPFHDALIQRGMRIMNNSWEYKAGISSRDIAKRADEYRDFIHHHDGLVVFGTGNDGTIVPSDISALPSQPGPDNSRPAADLERGWLAVAALDKNDRTALAEYSNACGVAMDYCLVAPGEVIVPTADVTPNAPEYQTNRGTSFAAPIVSGAAALVWEAFPYFNNDLVRQTLLGTATDLGAPGVDPIFGHGAVNIARAVKGPAQLDWGDMRVGFDGGTSTWGNDLSGDGALIKDGNGTLVLEGRLRNRDGLFVDAGVVQALQTIDGATNVAAPAGLLLGDGTRGGDIGGTLDNAGQVYVMAYGTDVNTTQVGGDYLHKNTATLGLELGQKFSVQGEAVIEGGTFHLLGIKPGYTHTAREEVLSARAGVRGEFSHLTWANSLFLDGRLSYTQNQAWLDINRLNVTTTAGQLEGASATTLSGAERMEQAFTALDTKVAQGQAQDMDDALWHTAGQFQQLNDPATALTVLDSLSGQAHVRAITLAFDNIELGRRAVASHLADRDANPAKSRTWTQALGGNGGVSGGWSQSGWMIGQDHALGAQAVMGFAFGESQAQASLSRERSQARQTQAQLYLGRTGEHGYLSSQLGFGRSQRHMLRHPLADRWQGVSSQSTARYGNLSLEAGSTLAFGTTAVLTPYVGVEYSRLNNDRFQELGGAGFGLRTEAASMQRTQAVFGLRGAGHWRGLDIDGHAEWQQVMSADGFDVMASFTGIDSWAPLPMADAARSGGVFGVSVKAQLSPKAGLSANLDQHFGPRGNESVAMLRYERKL